MHNLFYCSLNIFVRNYEDDKMFGMALVSVLNDLKVFQVGSNFEFRSECLCSFCLLFKVWSWFRVKFVRKSFKESLYGLLETQLETSICTIVIYDKSICSTSVWHFYSTGYRRGLCRSSAVSKVANAEANFLCEDIQQSLLSACSKSGSYEDMVGHYFHRCRGI